jgi:hypothetical protein
MRIFEVKNGIYSIDEMCGETFKYKTFYLVFDKRYPEDDGILIEANKFQDWKKKGIKYYFGIPSDCTPKDRCRYIEHTFYTSREYLNGLN